MSAPEKLPVMVLETMQPADIHPFEFDPRLHARLDIERPLAGLIPEILCVELTVKGIRNTGHLAPLLGGIKEEDGEAPADRYRRALELGRVGRLAAKPAGEAIAASPLAVAILERELASLRATAAAAGAKAAAAAEAAAAEAKAAQAAAPVAPEGAQAPEAGQ